MNVIEQICATKVVPVITIEDASQAVNLADALTAGGISCAEVTFRTAAAADAIAAIAKARPNFFVGAGTVITVEQARRAVDAGAKFLVSPGLSPKVAEFCKENDIVLLPGVCTPTEIMAAMEYGLRYLKFFPADAMGGMKTLKAFAGPFKDVKFMPTGGISAANVKETLEAPFIYACGGSWIAPAKLIKACDWAAITALVKETCDIIKG